MDRLDTEDRMDRAMLCLATVREMCAAHDASNHIEPFGMAALLDLIHAEMQAALPRTLSRRLGDNDED